MILRYVFILTLAALTSSLPAPTFVFAQDVEWSLSAGPLGANVADLLYDDQGTAWAAIEFGGGVYSSDDGGNSWTQKNDGLPNRDSRALVYDSENSLFLLATEGGGIYVTNDGADSWVARNSGLDNLFLSGLFHQGDEVVWVGTQGSGPYRSDDNGLNWSPANSGISDAVVNDFAVTANGNVFAATIVSGIQRSDDDGQSWEQVGLGIGTSWFICFEVDANDMLFAGSNRGIFRSNDAGDTWEEINTGIPANTFVRDIQSINATTLAIATSRGIYYSTNAGDTWTERSAGLSDTDVHAIAADDELLVGARNDAGIYRSDNLGIEWRSANDGLFAVGIWSLVRADDGTVYAGSQAAVYRSADDGDTWQRTSDDLPQNTIWSVYLPSDGKIFAGLDGGVWQSTDNGQNWTLGALRNVTVYAFDRAPGGTLWAATSDGMFKSDDNGDSWEQSGLDDKLMTSLEIDLDGNLFAGQFFQGVYRSVNNGADWTEANIGLFNRNVTSLAANTVGTWFAGTRGGVYYSLNKGQGWESVNSGLSDTEVLTLAINNRDDVFAGTFSGGVFRSKGPNQDWEALNEGLLTPSVQALEMSNFDVLFAGTLAGSVYRTEGTTNPVEIEMPDDAEICPGQSVVLTTELLEGFPEYTQTWSPATGLNDPQLQSPTATPDVTTRYYITVTDRSGFEKRDSVLITVKPRPEFDPGEPIIICEGESEQREFPTEFSYSWSPSSGISCTDCPNPEFSPAVTTSYNVVISRDGCDRQESLIVTVNPKPVITVEQNVNVCPGESAQLNASGGVAYSWSPADDLDDPTSPTPTVTPTESRQYTLTVTGENGCESTIPVAVKVLDAPEISVSSDVVICAGRSTVLRAVGAESYRWEPADGLSCTDCQDPRAQPNITTVYTVYGTDAQGCVGQAQVTVEVRETPDVSFSSDDIYFGVLSACETSAEENLTVNNNGEFPITLRSTGLLDGNFSIIQPRLPQTIEPGASLVFTLRYTPQSPGGHQANLEFDALPCPINQPIQLSGENQGVVVRAEPGTVLYTRAELCSDPPNPNRNVTVTNSSAGAVSLQTIDLDGAFTFSGPQLPLTLAAGEATAFTIQLNAGLVDPVNGEFSINYQSETCNGALKIALLSEGAQFDVTTSDDVRICRGESTRLSAQAENAVTYDWFPASGLDDPNSPTPVARPFSTTVYQVTVMDADGCMVTESVEVSVETVEEPRIDQDGTTLTCSVDDVSYEWLLDGFTIEGAAQKTYVAETSGRYRVVVRSPFGCTDTSDVVNVITTSITERDAKGASVELFPNPVTEQLSYSIRLPQARQAQLKVYSALGRRIVSRALQLEANSQTRQLDVTSLAAGVYYLVIEYPGGRIAAPFVRE